MILRLSSRSLPRSASRRTSTRSGASSLCLVLLFSLGLLPVIESRGQDTLTRSIENLIREHAGQVAVVVKPAGEAAFLEIDSNEPFPTASLIKVPVMLEAYRQAERGDLNLDDRVVLREEDQVPGSGILTTHFSPGTEISIRDAIRLMIAFSDNTATNLVVDQIGLEATAKAMEELGFAETKLHSYVFRRESSVFPERRRKYGLGSTTASEMARLLEGLLHHEFASKEASREMLAHLYACQDRAKLARFLPANARISHKSGAVAAVRCDAGILETRQGPVVVVVLTSANEDQSWGEENSAEVLCGRVGEAVWTHFQAEPASDQAERNEEHSAESTTAGELAVGSSGKLVEDLQRTLNARLEPSADLNIDGDFGPITEAAVRRFQQQHDLEATGIVDAATWQHLGPLVTRDEPVEPPEVVNQQPLSREPADTLEGSPFVTAKAWAIADGQTGELLAGENEEQSLPMASTTKVMTAYLILKRAAKQPEILQEIVTFSPRAAETIGSSSGLRAGERVSVGELLYGLLLPSGNDASVALAEHFGERWFTSPGDLETKEGSQDEEQGNQEHEEEEREPDNSLSNEQKFISLMNAEAERLGMSATRFANPHGLSARGHHASASDLLILARAAMKVPRFGEYVGTRRRGCEVEGEGGYRRYVVWNNTNQLLRIDGYEGIKTGTTSAAGACLVSSVRRDDRWLLAVVLGADSSASRYTETRNLFRWAWKTFP
jgi:serine-type D-Ala-D-Ala carboxypeptidase (penicillin-binding protein 5/6)